MNLAIDIGNSMVKIGRVDGSGEIAEMEQIAVSEMTAGWLARFGDELQTVVIGRSGRLGLCDEIRDFFQSRAERVIVVSSADPVPFESRYAAGQAGVDRLANVATVISRRLYPAIVIDGGTAITLEVVDADGVFLGGAILPGIELQASALQRGTEDLPGVKGTGETTAIGRNTDEAIKAGLVYGAAGAVERLVRGAMEELKAEGQVSVVFTGGDGKRILRVMDGVDGVYDAWFTLRGIWVLGEGLPTG